MDYSPPGSSVHGILQARILSGLPQETTQMEVFPEEKTKWTGDGGGMHVEILKGRGESCASPWSRQEATDTSMKDSR